jgi:hypothetical protein
LPEGEIRRRGTSPDLAFRHIAVAMCLDWRQGMPLQRLQLAIS